MKNYHSKSIFMIIIIALLVLFGCGKPAATTSEANKTTAGTSAAQTREITDMAGRKLTVPAKINKAYGASQIGTILLYSLNPDKLAGWGFALSAEQKKFIDEKYHNLPVLGVWSEKSGSANIEEIIKIHPDFILSMGRLTDSDKSSAEHVQQKTGIPVVIVDGSLEKLDKVYELIGDLLDEKDKAKDLGDYCKSTIVDTKAKVATIPEDKRVQVYYAEGASGLETDPKGSYHTEVLDLVGGINVANIPAKQGYGRTTISLEQFLIWNPEVIIMNYDQDANVGFFSNVYNDIGWKDSKAVKNKKIYQIPSYPFDWFDRPPSINRIIGVKWLANLLYPQTFKLDIQSEVKNFYEKFYHKNLTDQEVAKLLKNAV